MFPWIGGRSRLYGLADAHRIPVPGIVLVFVDAQVEVLCCPSPGIVPLEVNVETPGGRKSQQVWLTIRVAKIVSKIRVAQRIWLRYRAVTGLIVNFAVVASSADEDDGVVRAVVRYGVLACSHILGRLGGDSVCEPGLIVDSRGGDDDIHANILQACDGISQAGLCGCCHFLHGGAGSNVSIAETASIPDDRLHPIGFGGGGGNDADRHTAAVDPGKCAQGVIEIECVRPAADRQQCALFELLDALQAVSGTPGAGRCDGASGRGKIALGDGLGRFEESTHGVLPKNRCAAAPRCDNLTP